MINRITYLSFLFAISAIVMQSCQKIKTYPPEPYIELISFEYEYVDDALGNPSLSGTLTFYFVDGDGDIGFKEPSEGDTVVNNTVFIDKYRMKNGEYKPVDLIVPFEYRVPYFSTSGNNKTLEGEIIITDIIETSNIHSDTIKYDFYIKDRAGNKSNVETTGDLILRDFLD